MINRITNAIYNKIFGRKDAEIAGLRKELRAASNELFDLRRLSDLVNVHIRPLGENIKHVQLLVGEPTVQSWRDYNDVTDRPMKTIQVKQAICGYSLIGHRHLTEFEETQLLRMLIKQSQAALGEMMWERGLTGLRRNLDKREDEND